MPTKSIFGGQRDAAGYTSRVLGLSKAKPNGDPYDTQFTQSLDVTTRAADLLFAVIDNPMREQYHTAWKKLQPAQDELFTPRAVLIKLLTEAHTDCNGWEN
ncbi:MAG: hypothetical protein M1840_006735 [Geoglossum simile]|nr:MAG: hypothetical protein M1840_006735 [Geoglossum simile]